MKHAWKIFAALAVCPVLLGASLAMAQSDDDDWPSDDEAPAVSTPAAPVAVAAPKSNVKKIALALPGPPRFAPITSQKIKAAEAKVRKYPTTKQWRDLSEMYLQIGRRDKAASALRSEAALHRRIGTTQAALIMEQRAAQYETDIRLFLDRAATPTELKTLDTKATLEPAVGTYLGAFIDHADRLPTTWQDENWRTHRNFDEWQELTGRPHATYFMYMGYGSQFPRQWLQKIKDAGAIGHLALEPHKINDVKNDEYLQNFAKECGRMDVPIFLRYASEMNGKWTKWNGQPDLYKEKWKIVRNVFKQHAPKVAIVWCPNAVPLNDLMDYYPGDEYVDWVGINVYSVPYFDGDPRNSAENVTPLEMIDPIYKAFAHKKPIAICEYGASQMSTDKKPRYDFAINKMALFYSALPRIYPRIKMISWFDMNTLKYAEPARRLNNYSVTESDKVLHAYRGTTNSPYFIEGGNISGQITENAARAFPRPVSVGQIIAPGKARFSLWVKSYVTQPKVYFQIGKKIVYAGQVTGAHVFDVDTKSIKSGRQPVTIFVFDDKNRFVASETITLSFGKTRGDEPMSVSGRVLNYYALGENRIYQQNAQVQVIQVETSGGNELVYFAPQMASQMLEEYPEGAEISLWIKGGKLVGLGEDKPESWFDTNFYSRFDEEGTVTFRAPNKLTSNDFLMQTDAIREAQKMNLRLHLPPLARERGGENVEVKPLTKETVRPW